MNEHGEQIHGGILKGITSGGKEEVASSKGRMGNGERLHGNCERHRHGEVGCARIVKETPNGAENTDSASSFLSFFLFPFSPSFLQHPSLTIFRRIRSNRTPSYVAWPIEHAKIASVPSLSREKS